MEEEEESSIWMFCKFIVKDLLDKFVVTGSPLAGVVGDEEVVAQEDDGGQEVPDTRLILVTFHQLTHSNTLEEYFWVKECS